MEIRQTHLHLFAGKAGRHSRNEPTAVTRRQTARRGAPWEADHGIAGIRHCKIRLNVSKFGTNLNPGKTPVPAVKARDEIERLYGELAAHMHAKDEKGVKQVFRELLDTGRSREEIVSEVIGLLDKKPSAADQPSNGTDQHWLTEPRASVARSQVERHQSPMAWPDIAPQFSTGAADRQALGPSSERATPEPGSWQEPSRDKQEHPNALQIENSPNPVLESNSNREGSSAKGQANESTGPSFAKNEAEPYLPALEAPARGQTKKSRRPSFSKDRAEASMSSPEAAPAGGQASTGTRTPSPPTKSTEHLSAPENATPRGGEASKSTPTPNSTKNNVETDVPTESSIPPRPPVSTSAPTPGLGKDGLEAYVSMAPAEPSESPGQAEKLGDKRDDATRADRKPMSDSSEKALESFFANTSPRQVGLRSDSTRESVAERLTSRSRPPDTTKEPNTTKEAVTAPPDDAAADWSRLASRLQLQSSGTSSGKPGTIEKAAGARTDDALANWSESSKPHRRRSVAVRLLSVASILVSVIGGSYVIWSFYGNDLEQARVASARRATTWLQDIRSSGLSLKPEAATTVDKAVDPQPTEAVVATTVPESARTEQTTLPEVASPLPEAGAPKPRDGSIGFKDASQSLNNLGVPSAPPAEPIPSATKRGEPDTTSQSARSKGKNAALNAVPPIKPPPPAPEASLSSGTTPQSVTSEGTREGNQSPPVSAASQGVASIDAAGLVTRGDQLLAMRDVASARLFYERAAQAGDGQGALRMGMTFDPVFLDRSGFRSVRGDPTQAVSWYNRAAALGNSAAEGLKKMLTSSKR
jgi:hypothetical protein